MPNVNAELKIKQFVPKEKSVGTNGEPTGKRTRPRVPDEQRKRARQACESCRQRKEKCYGGIPCQRCARDNTVCTLAADGGSNLEQAPHAPLSKAERTVFLERVLKNVLGITSLPDSELRAMDEALLTPSEIIKPTEERERSKPDYGSESSLLTFSRQLQQKLGGSRVHEEEDRSERIHQSRSTTNGNSNLVKSARAVLPAKHVAEALIAVCFTYVQCNSFFVSVQWINKTLDACYHTTDNLCDEDIPNITTLSMIIALGTQFASMAPSLASMSSDHLGCSMEELGNRLYEHATSVLSELIKRPTFESMRSCLLIATYLFPIDLPRIAYAYLGLALHMGIRSGMHKKNYYSAHDHTSHSMREEHVRVWWTLYTFYQRARIFHGHPRTLAHSEVDVDRPRPAPELEPSNGISNFRNQVALIDVTLILEDVAGEIALLRKARRGVHVANLLAYRRKLAGLLDELPTLHTQDLPDANLHSLRLDIHVYLHYWHTRLFLGRPFLLSHSKPTSSRVEDGTSPPTTITSGRELLAQDSVDAAFRIVDLCQLIHDRIGLARASYATEFTSCRAAMLVLIAASIIQRSDEVANTLSQGLLLIQQMSVGHGQASLETRVIVALQRAITRLHHEENSSKLMSTSEEEELPQFEDHFQQWERLWQNSSQTPQNPPMPPEMEETSTLLQPDTGIPLDPSPLRVDEFPDPGGFGFDDDANDWWTTMLNTQLDEFTLIPDMEGL